MFAHILFMSQEEMIEQFRAENAQMRRHIRAIISSRKPSMHATR
jgi:hypothetical protein